jgi:polyisoprenoid-binding protein YceI
MSRTTRSVLAAVLLLVGIIAGVLLIIWISGGDGTASQSANAAVETAEAARATAEAAATEAVDNAEAMATEVMDEVEAMATEAMEAMDADATPEATAAMEATEEAPAETSASDAGEAVTFVILGTESSARFELDEDLRGQRITVVGTTEGDEDVAGEITVNAANPSASSVGTLAINVRSLRTDNEFRDRAIRGQILRSADDANEFAIFVPTELSGLPDSVSVGDEFTFELTGDLTLQQTTVSVTFEVTVTAVSETRIEGSAEATINRNDFGLTIPNAPGVANVEEEVLLVIDFVAEAQ